MSAPAIAILPYGQRLGPKLATMSLDDLIWPLGRPDRLDGKAVGDLRVDDHLIIFARTDAHFRLRRGTKARISLLVLEPSVIHGKHLRLLRATHGRFFRVLTWHEDLLARIPNGIFFPFGTTWVPQWRDLPLDKRSMTSLIASAKRDTTGHRLRHQIVDRVREAGLDVTIMGRGYEPFESKADGLAPFRYSVVIENVRERNYFSEKLVDAVLCNTVPIYWGCPNLERFVDTSAVIQCDSAEDIFRAIHSASADDFARRLPFLQAMQPDLARYCDLELRAAQAVLAVL